MTFRRTRWSNDLGGWIVMAIMSLPAAFLVLVSIAAASMPNFFQSGAIIWVIACAIFVFGFGSCLYAVIVLFELEIVAENGEIRHGRTDSPKRQKRYRLKEIRSVCKAEDAVGISIDINHWHLPQVGGGILSAADTEELLAYLREHHPEIRIVERSQM